MSENFNSHIACEGTDNDINWVCKVCKDLPNYAGMYLYQREREKNQLKNVKDRRADLILLKYYYALLHLLDKIHELHECPNPENDVPKYADRKCSTPECFVYYRYIYNTYASILMTEKGLNQINLRCDICSVLPYTIFSDLEMIAKNMHSDDMEKPLNSDIDVAMYDKIGKKLLIIECKWKENVYQNRENYIKIEDALKKIYDNQLEKHQTYLERDINRLNELFDNQIDFTREGDVDTLYLFVDKRIQYHDNGTNRHVIPIFMLAYLFENNSSKRQLILSDVFSEIREMKSRVRYERIKLKEPVHLGEITVI